eukprot:CAMPEP_0194203728 /NCGR_PEP_ID=MMETSP0156-20130528/3421_1 /TAXON_ID=33649 /ORGANISM="Thalassionema nitzschioides, Strain L26-B" /LENGTH=1108 /DNA_ID=CAMNT_0038929535 /DNA_START=75 /DNA_END=3401 /DNA_ORIENTATION=+
MSKAIGNTFEETFEFQKLLILGGPVTCVSFLLGASEYLVAKGPWIEIYRDDDVVKRHLIFKNGGSIHGVRNLDDSTILIFGGQQVAFVDKDSFEVQLVSLDNPIEYLTICDWIWDVNVLQQGAHYFLALGLANNVCEVWFLDRTFPGTFTARRLCRRLCELRCITYCMSFDGWTSISNNKDLKLASGTVFNEILIWMPIESIEMHPNEEMMTKRCPIEHKLLGHKGVILALNFNEEGDQLVSASDDRSVRLWRLVFDQQQGQTWTQTWVGWGHTARVWNVCFSCEGLVSTGEDGTSRLWDNLNGEQLGQIRNYASQSIWSIDVCNNFALLGTNDGSVKIWNLRCKTTHALGTEYPCLSTILIPDDRPKITPEASLRDTDRTKTIVDRKKKKKKTNIKAQVIFGIECYQRATDDYALAVGTRHGSLFIFSLYDFKLQETTNWHDGIEDNMVRTTNASCLAISRYQIAAIGTTKGELVIRRLNCAENPTFDIINARNFKSIQKVSWCKDDLVASFHIKGIIVLWQVSKIPTNSVVRTVLNTTTSVIPICIYPLSSGKGFVVGDSCGNVSLFSTESDSSDEIYATSVCKKVHAKQHINQIKTFKDGRVISVGNDGCIAECFITNGNILVRGTSIPISGISGVSQMWYGNLSLETLPVIVAGYYGNVFTVIDYASNFELVKFETGGRQRKISHLMSVSPEGNLQFSRQSIAVCLNRKDGRNEVTLYSNLYCKHSKLLHNRAKGVSLHGEPIYDACMFTTAEDVDHVAVVSGSEDCTAKLSFLVNDTVKTSFSLPPQESCIRAVAASRKSCSPISLIAIGGGKLSIDFYLIKDANVPGNSFRGNLIQIYNIGKGGTHDMTNIDHRINAIKALPNPFVDEANASHFVAIGDSNGNVGFFIVQEDRKHERFIIPKYHVTTQDRPVLSLDILLWKNSFLIVVGSTSGDISIWCVAVNQGATLTYNAHKAPIHEFKTHQMGTNTICTSILNNSTSSMNLLLCSAGDDQAISVIELLLSRGSNKEISVTVLSNSVTPEADVSAVKGVHFIGKSKFISVGYGQKMLLWNWSRSKGSQLLSAIGIDVCDVNCLAFCRVRNRALAAAGGEGLEIIEVHENN